MRHHLRNCIFACHGSSNCGSHDINLLFGIICEKHLNEIFSIGKKLYESKTPTKDITFGPWMIIAPGALINRGDIIIPYKQVVDDCIGSSTIPNNLLITYMSERLLQYFDKKNFIHKSDLRSYQLEVLRNLTLTNIENVDILPEHREKAVALKAAVTSTLVNIKELYDRISWIKRYNEACRLQIMLESPNIENIAAVQLSPFEQILNFYMKCGGVSENLDAQKLYNLQIIKNIGWTFTAKTLHPDILCLKGQITDSALEEEKTTKFQRSAINNCKNVFLRK